MDSIGKRLIATSLLLLFGQLSAQADGLEISADVGLSKMNWDSNSTTNAADSYYGINNSIEACETSGNDYNLCGGAFVFTSLGNGSKTTAGVTVKTGISSVGGFVKAKKQVGIGSTISPYAGVARVSANHEISGGGGIISERSNIIFGGIEFDQRINDTMSLSLKAEAGRSIGSSIKTKVFSFKPGLKVTF